MPVSCIYVCVTKGLAQIERIFEPPDHMSEHGLIYISCAIIMMQIDYISAGVTSELHA